MRSYSILFLVSMTPVFSELLVRIQILSAFSLSQESTSSRECFSMSFMFSIQVRQPQNYSIYRAIDLTISSRVSCSRSASELFSLVASSLFFRMQSITSFFRSTGSFIRLVSYPLCTNICLKNSLVLAICLIGMKQNLILFFQRCSLIIPKVLPHGQPSGKRSQLPRLDFASTYSWNCRPCGGESHIRKMILRESSLKLILQALQSPSRTAQQWSNPPSSLISPILSFSFWYVVSSILSVTLMSPWSRYPTNPNSRLSSLFLSRYLAAMSPTMRLASLMQDTIDPVQSMQKTMSTSVGPPALLLNLRSNSASSWMNLMVERYSGVSKNLWQMSQNYSLMSSLALSIMFIYSLAFEYSMQLCISKSVRLESLKISSALISSPPPLSAGTIRSQNRWPIPPRFLNLFCIFSRMLSNLSALMKQVHELPLRWVSSLIRFSCCYSMSSNLALKEWQAWLSPQLSLMKFRDYCTLTLRMSWYSITLYRFFWRLWSNWLFTFMNQKISPSSLKMVLKAALTFPVAALQNCATRLFWLTLLVILNLGFKQVRSFTHSITVESGILMFCLQCYSGDNSRWLARDRSCSYLWFIFCIMELDDCFWRWLRICSQRVSFSLMRQVSSSKARPIVSSPQIFSCRRGQWTCFCRQSFSPHIAFSQGRHEKIGDCLCLHRFGSSPTMKTSLCSEWMFCQQNVLRGLRQVPSGREMWTWSGGRLCAWARKAVASETRRVRQMDSLKSYCQEETVTFMNIKGFHIHIQMGSLNLPCSFLAMRQQQKKSRYRAVWRDPPRMFVQISRSYAKQAYTQCTMYSSRYSPSITMYCPVRLSTSLVLRRMVS